MTQTLLLPPTAVPTSTLGGRHDTQQLIRITSPRWPRSVPLLGRQLNILGRVIVCIVWINVPILLDLAIRERGHAEQSKGTYWAVLRASMCNCIGVIQCNSAYLRYWPCKRCTTLCFSCWHCLCPKSLLAGTFVAAGLLTTMNHHLLVRCFSPLL